MTGVVTPAIRNLIREGKTHQIYSAMQAGAQHGFPWIGAPPVGRIGGLAVVVCVEDHGAGGPRNEHFGVHGGRCLPGGQPPCRDPPPPEQVDQVVCIAFEIRPVGGDVG